MNKKLFLSETLPPLDITYKILDDTYDTAKVLSDEDVANMGFTSKEEFEATAGIDANILAKVKGVVSDLYDSILSEEDKLDVLENKIGKHISIYNFKKASEVGDFQLQKKALITKDTLTQLKEEISQNDAIVNHIVDTAINDFQPNFYEDAARGMLLEDDITDLISDSLPVVNENIDKINKQRSALLEHLETAEEIAQDVSPADISKIEKIKKQIDVSEDEEEREKLTGELNALINKKIEYRRVVSDEELKAINKAYAIHFLSEPQLSKMIKDKIAGETKKRTELGKLHALSAVQHRIVNTAATNAIKGVMDVAETFQPWNLSDDQFLVSPFMPTLIAQMRAILYDHNKKISNDFKTMLNMGYYFNEAITDEEVDALNASKSNPEEYKKLYTALSGKVSTLIEKYSVPELDETQLRDALVEAKNRMSEREQVRPAIETAVSALKSQYNLPEDVLNQVRIFLNTHQEYIDAIASGKSEVNQLDDLTSFIAPDIYIFDYDKFISKDLPFGTKGESMSDVQKDDIERALSSAGFSQHSGQYILIGEDWKKFLDVINSFLNYSAPAGEQKETTAMKKEAVYFGLFKEYDQMGSPWKLDKEKGVISKINQADIVKESDIIDRAIREGGVWDHSAGETVYLETDTSPLPVKITSRLSGRSYEVETPEGNKFNVAEAQLISNKEELFK